MRERAALQIFVIRRRLCANIMRSLDSLLRSCMLSVVRAPEYVLLALKYLDTFTGLLCPHVPQEQASLKPQYMDHYLKGKGQGILCIYLLLLCSSTISHYLHTE